MKEISVNIDTWLNKELIVYLSNIKGIDFVKINDSKNELYIKYNENLINLKIILEEILLFLKLRNIPSILSFNKYSKNSLEVSNFEIEDLCCEYCLKNIIEKLLFIDGIEECYTNFDYHNKENISITIKYDKNLINEDTIKKIISKKKWVE